jgi:hypothetical protein
MLPEKPSAHLRRIAAAIGLSFAARSALAQGPDSTCRYEYCALSIAPRLLALDVVRGVREERVASLAFLFPARVTSVFAGNEAAEQRATHAFRLRRVAAVLTDVGAIVVASAGSHAVATAHRRGASVTLSGVGLAIIASSVPIHFAADGELSRAVWEYNRRFNR